MLYLHRLDDQQRRARGDLLAGTDENRRDHPWQTREKRSAVRNPAAVDQKRIVHQKRVAQPVREDRDFCAAPNHDGIEPSAGYHCAEFGIRTPVPGDGKNLAIALESAIAAHGVFAPRIARRNRYPAPKSAAEPPAAPIRPGRTSTAARRPPQLGQRRENENVVIDGGGGTAEGVEMPRDKSGIRRTGSEFRMIHDRSEERLVGDGTRHPNRRQRRRQAAGRDLPIRSMGDDLGDHRVVMRGDLVSFADAGIDSHVRLSVRQRQMRNPACPRSKSVYGIFRVKAGLDRMAGKSHLLLAKRKRLASGDAQLPLHDVDPGDHFGHRVLDLNAGVHLQKPVAAVGVDQELHCPGARIVDGPGRRRGGLAQPSAKAGADARRRRFLDDLLMAALHGTVALSEMNDVSVPVPEYLHLHMARAPKVLLDQHGVVPERGCRFPARRGERAGKVRLRFHDPYAATAAAGCGFHHHGISDRRGRGGQRFVVLRRIGIAVQNRHAGRGHDSLGGRLRTHGPDRIGRRTDERDPGSDARGGEFRVFRQKAETGMDGLRSGAPSGIDDGLSVQITRGRRRGADPYGFVRQFDVQRTTVRS